MSPQVGGTGVLSSEYTVLKTQTWVPIMVELSAAAPGLYGEKPGQYLDTKHQQTSYSNKNNNLENP
jgi:hypothetical protein